VNFLDVARHAFLECARFFFVCLVGDDRALTSERKGDGAEQQTFHRS
jgi:hypothetical protein